MKMPKKVTQCPAWGIQPSISGGKVHVKTSDDCELKYIGADFPQIVDAQLTIHPPLTDTEVQLSFSIKNKKSGESQEQDVSLLVQGEHGAQRGEKPCVVPEPAQWYASAEGIIPAASLQSVSYSGDGLEQPVHQFAGELQRVTGQAVSVCCEKVEKQGAICFAVTRAVAYLGEEGYQINTNANGVQVQVSAAAGAVWAGRTILQLVCQGGIPFGEMRDYPRYPVRGFMLDVGRRPVSLATLQKIIDTMSWYKMNDFQVHLSDNYIFLEDYGSEDSKTLAAYEAFRLESGIKNADGETATAKDYHYSKAEFRDLIAYAVARGVRIVPELDVPAHALALTKVFPEHMVKDMKSPLTAARPLTDHLDIRQPGTVAFIKRVFDEYTRGEQPVFPQNVTVHIGADEFFCDYKAYRAFYNEIIPYLKQTNPVRVWGGLTWIKDDPVTPIIPEAVADVQVNLWASEWADGREMYDMGYQLINTIDQLLYMVPNGSGKRGAYQDYLDKKKVFQAFSPGKVRLKNGKYESLPAGDRRVLGAAFAIWNDNIDKRASGLSEDDLFARFLDAVPLLAEKTWGSCTAQALDVIDAKAQRVGLPGEEQQADAGELALCGEEQYGAVYANDCLRLQGGVSYVNTGRRALPLGSAVTLELLLYNCEPGQILLEADAPYGSYDLRITENGKLGFTREGYAYEFDYKPPVNRRFCIEILSKPGKTVLKTGRFGKKKAEGCFIHNERTVCTGIRNTSFAVPCQRVGSARNAAQAEIYRIVYRPV